MKKIVALLFITTTLLFAKFTSIDANRLIELQKKGVVVVDIRTPKEWKERGIIPNAKTITFFKEDGRVDFIAFMRELTKYVKNSNQPFIIYCAHANRTKVVGKILNSLGVKNLYELDGGIEYGWINKGKKTTKDIK